MEKKVQEIVRRGFDSTIESLIGQLELVAMDIIKGRVHFDNAPGVEAFHDTRAYELLVASKLTDRKSTRLNSSHIQKSRMPSSA